MTGPIYLSLVFHNHQPVGQFGYVSEHSTNVAYLPLIETLERFPAVKVALHYSGALLDWLKHEHPEVVARLKTLVDAGQVELLSGGYYEPALTALRDEDKIGQIEKLNDELHDTFGIRPIGMWLAERIWEPHLARPIHQAGMRYVLVDDTHFELVGFDKETQLFGYFMTEEQGHTVAVFPSLTYLRYAIPWEPVETVLEWLRERALSPEELGGRPRLALMGDNGEKLGTWPGSYEHCWGDGRYIEALFDALTMNSEWLRTITPGAFMRQFSPLGRAYLPTASYQEMGTWSLLPDDAARLEALRRRLSREKERGAEIARFLHGGLWRNFMVKIEEVNHLHKRALMVSEKVHAMRRGRRRERALDLLWAAQGNDPYWHGLYGGAYLFNIRVATYANLIAAEDVTDSEENRLSLRQYDFDCDGHDDLIVGGQPLNAIWSPAVGGSLIELDYRPAQYNLFNVMTRRKEGYHADLIQAVADHALAAPGGPEPEVSPNRVVRAKETGLEARLIYDTHRRVSFIDHFLEPSATLDEFYHADFVEQGDFVSQGYRILEATCNGQTATVSLERTGRVWMGSYRRTLTVRKVFYMRFGEPSLHVRYTLSHTEDRPLDMRFGIETVVGFDGGQDITNSSLWLNGDNQRLPLNAIREFESIQHYSADTNLHNLTLRTEISRPAFLWMFPLETITLSEGGFERGYQGTVFLHVWSIRLEPNETWEVNITQTASQTATRP